MKKYSFTKGYRCPVSAEIVGSEIERITERDGVVKTTVLLDEARPYDSPLHPIPEWDDQIAAEEYRKNQIRRLVRAVRVEVQTETAGKKVDAPVVIHSPHGGGYYSPDAIKNDIDLFESALSSALAKLRSAQSAVSTLERLAVEKDDSGLFAKISIVLKSMAIAENALNDMRH